MQILEQIAGIITGDDQRAMEEVRLCTREPQVYQQQYCGRYRERGIDLPDAAGNDLQWLGVADILIEHGMPRSGTGRTKKRILYTFYPSFARLQRLDSQFRRTSWTRTMALMHGAKFWRGNGARKRSV